MKRTKVYISYAGGKLDSENFIEKNREAFANHLKAEFEKYNFEVVIDKSNLGYRESIKKFTDFITNGEYIVTIVSQKYLSESRYCQEEIREIIHKQKSFYPIVTFDAEDITQSSEKHKYIDRAQIFIDKYAEKHFRDKEKSKFLECKLTIDDFVTKLNDEIVLTQNQYEKLIRKVLNDKNESVKKIREELDYQEINHFVFEYASILEKFGLLLPVSLYKKLNESEWKLLEKDLRADSDDSIGVTLVGSFLKPEEEHLKLNNYGKAKSLTSESQDELIYQILIHCNAEIDQEYKLFESLTLKKKYSESIFENFSHSIESLILDSDKLYPQRKKQTLLYRLLAIHYSKKGEEKLMREAFSKCINLLKNDDSNDLTGFFIGWAQKEKENGNYKKSFEISNQVLTIFKEKRINTAARFNLAIHYYRDNNTEKALSYFLEKFKNQFIFKTEDFWDKFSSKTFSFLRKGFTEDAKVLKLVLIELANFFDKKKLFNLASYVHKKIKESIELNVNFKKNLINSFLKDDLEKNVIKSYIKLSDITKAKKILSELEKSSISRIEYIGLLIDLSYAEGHLENAIFKGEKFIKENPDINVHSIYIRIANIYFNNKKLGIKRYYKSIYYYNKINSTFLENNYMYAIALMNTRNEAKAIKIFRNYFSSKNENNKFPISNYITCCLRLKRDNEASKFIIKKILDRRKEQYSNSFISFLYQQQIKLTKDKTYSNSLLKEALKFSDNDNLRETVYNRYAEHLTGNIKFQHNKFNKPFNFNELEIGEAIVNFNNSIYHNELQYKKEKDNFDKLTKGDKTEVAFANFNKLLDFMEYKKEKKYFSIAECYFYLTDYKSSMLFLNKIKNAYLQEKTSLLKLQINFKRKEFVEIEKYLGSHSKKVKTFSLLCLGKNFSQSFSKRKAYLLEAVNLDKSYYSKLQQAIVLYSINQKRLSLEIVSNLIDNNKFQKHEIKEEFENNISRYKPRVKQEDIEVIQSGLRGLNSQNAGLIIKIDNLISDYPFNERILGFKFNYFFKLKYYKKCENVLNTIIKKKLFYNRTSHLFYELSNLYFKKSNSYNRKSPTQTDLIENFEFIEKSDYYLSYAVDSFYSKFKIKKLSAMIAYKKGDFKNYNSVVKNLIKDITEIQKTQLSDYLNKEKKKINIFLWSQIQNDYYSKLQFYKFQVNTVAATIIGDTDQKDKSSAIKILKTISFDSEFNKENNFNLLTSINTRRAHYYFHIKRNYKLALNYQKKVWRKKIYDLNFTGAFLRNITNCKSFDFGIKCCEAIIERNNSAITSRFYGNFLKEKNRHQEAHISYNIAFDLACDIKESNLEEIQRKQREKTHTLNNIAMLIVKSVQENDFFMDKKKLKKMGLECIEKIHNIDPEFKSIKSKYVDDTTRKIKHL